MNRLSTKHKQILEKLASVYQNHEVCSKRYSKRCLRTILIRKKWLYDEAVRCIETGECEYWFCDE